MNEGGIGENYGGERGEKGEKSGPVFLKPIKIPLLERKQSEILKVTVQFLAEFGLQAIAGEVGGKSHNSASKLRGKKAKGEENRGPQQRTPWAIT